MMNQEGYLRLGNGGPLRGAGVVAHRLAQPALLEGPMIHE